MVERVQEGGGLRAVAREFRVTLSTVPRWVARAGGWPLDQVDWADQPSGCRVSSQRAGAGMGGQGAEVVADEERPRRVRGGIHSSRTPATAGLAAVGSDDRSGVGTSGCVGWATAFAAHVSAARLVPAEGRGGLGGIGHL